MRPTALALALAAAGTSAVPSNIVKFSDVAGTPYSVTYDKRSFFVNGNRTLFLSGCVHYPRSTPGMWDDLFAKAVNDGFNMVQTYWFWNAHQHKPDDWSFEFNTDVKLFLDKAAAAGLFVNFRIGPYVCAEWNYGGFPLWINDPTYAGGANLTTRSSNSQWETLMSTAFNRIVSELRPYFADRGGPIALSQVENEYAVWACDGAIGPCDQVYVRWSGDLAADSGVAIPFEMCNGYSANNTVDSCNGNDCTSYIESGGGNGRVLVDQPAMWTENEGWFQAWGQPYPQYTTEPGMPEDWEPSRTPDAMAYAVARWFARGGSHHNYYMWHGGNHYGRMAASSVANWYANAAPLNSDSLSNEPYRSHLQRLHHIIAEYASVLLSSEAQCWNRTYMEVYDRETDKWHAGDNSTIAFTYSNANGFIRFIENSRSNVTVLMRFPGTQEPQWLVRKEALLVLDDTGAVIFNTSDVLPATVNRTYTSITSGAPLPWWSYQDEVVTNAINGLTAEAASQAAVAVAGSSRLPFSTPSTVGTVIHAPVPYEQLNITEDDTEYVLYTRSVSSLEARRMWLNLLASARAESAHRANVDEAEIFAAAMVKAGTTPLFIEGQFSQAFIVFVNGVYSGQVFNNNHSFALNKATGKFDGAANFSLALDLSDLFAAFASSSASASSTEPLGSEADPLAQAVRVESASSSGDFVLSILSESIGLDNGHGAWVVGGQSLTSKGLFGQVQVAGVSIVNGGTWRMDVGLGGETLQVFTAAGAANVTWEPVAAASDASAGSDESRAPSIAAIDTSRGTNDSVCTSKGIKTSCEALTWYRTFFTTPSNLTSKLLSQGQGLNTAGHVDKDDDAVSVLPEVASSVLLDIGPNQVVTRGHFYLNGFDLGRYWSIYGFEMNAPGQRYYALPPDLLVPDVEGGNVLTLVDVTAGTDVTLLQIVLSELVPL